MRRCACSLVAAGTSGEKGLLARWRCAYTLSEKLSRAPEAVDGRVDGWTGGRVVLPERLSRAPIDGISIALEPVRSSPVLSTDDVRRVSRSPSALSAARRSSEAVSCAGRGCGRADVVCGSLLP